MNAPATLRVLVLDDEPVMLAVLERMLVNLGFASVQAFDRGGLEVLDASPAAFAAALTRENHTLKRALTDPRLFSGIGNAYSDEILHAARLSPVALPSTR